MLIGWATRDWAPAFPDRNGHPTLGGSGHYRVGLPARALAGRGHECPVGKLVSRPGATRRLGVHTWRGHEVYPPVVVLQRWMNAGLDAAIRAAREDGQVVVQDVDDAFDQLDPANRAHATTDARRNPWENRDHYRASLAASDLIVCSTPYLADQMRALAPTVLVRNRVDLDAAWPRRVPTGRTPAVGWVGALPWRSRGDLEQLQRFLGSFCRRNGLRFVHAGHVEGTTTDELVERVGLDGVEVEAVPMRPSTEIPRLWDSIDVAVIPLADVPFNRAKSAVGGLSAAAAKVPFVASDSPEYLWLRREAGIGRTARSKSQWLRHLEQLLDPVQRRRDAERNLLMASLHGMPALAKDWEAVLAKVAPLAVAARGVR